MIKDCEACKMMAWIEKNHSDKFPIVDDDERKAMFLKLAKQFKNEEDSY